MTTTNENKSERSAIRKIIVTAGTYANRILKQICTGELEQNIPENERPLKIAYDSVDVNPSQPIATVDADLEDVPIPKDAMLGADIHDAETRKTHNENGNLYMVDELWIENPGLADFNDGVGGDMRAGRALQGLNSNHYCSKINSHIRTIRDYENQPAGSASNANFLIDEYRMWSVCGGVGSGSTPTQIHLDNREAAVLSAKLRINPIIILLGSFNPPGRSNIRRNEQLALQNFVAYFEGKADPLNLQPLDSHYFSEAPIFISNLNPYGEIGTPLELQALAAKIVNTLVHTNVGDNFPQDCKNLLRYPPYDRYDRPKTGRTIGLSTIHCNGMKISATLSTQIALLLVEEFLKETQASEPLQRASNDAHRFALMEKIGDDATLKCLLKLRKLHDVDARERASAVFNARCIRRFWLEGCLQLRAAAHYVLGIEIPLHLKPQVEEHVDILYGETEAAVKEQLSNYLKDIHGVDSCQKYLTTLLDRIKNTMMLNQTKTKIVHQINAGLKANVEQYDSWLESFLKRSFLGKLLTFFKIFSFCRHYPVCAEMLIRNEIELMGRNALEKYLQNAASCIRNKLAGIETLRLKIADYLNVLKKEYNRVRNLPNSIYVPVGEEQAQPAFMDSVFAEFLEKTKGGQQKILDLTVGEYMRVFGTLEAFINDDTKRINATLTNYSKELIKTSIDGLHVFNIFKNTYPTIEQQREQVGSHMRESYGRVILKGMGNQEISCLRYVVAPDQQTCDYICTMANSIDRLGGDWRPIVNPNANEILFFQCLCGISIHSLIEDTYKLAPPIKDLKIWVQLGEDPVLQTIKAFDGTYDHIDRIVAQSCGSGAIAWNRNNYYFKHNGSMESMGNTLVQIRETLKKDHALLMRMHQLFAKYLAIKQGCLLEELECQHTAPPEGLMRELGPKPIQDAIIVGEFLLPYVRRLVLKDRY